MSSQVRINKFFPSSKVTRSSVAALSAAAPLTAAPSATAPSATTSSVTTRASRKRAASQASQASQSEPAQKRSRASDDVTGDDPASALSTDEVAKNEPDFPDGPPTVWAMTRSGLCDSQKLYRSHNAGAYTKDKKLFSLYINKYSEPRDFLGRAKLITCAGGGREQQDGKGPWVRNNTKPTIVESWEAAVDTPVVIIIGKDHPDFANLILPKDVRDHGAFVELATFMVTKIWKEMVKPESVREPYQVWKVMLQTMDPASKPWYWKDDNQHDATLEDSLDEEKNANDSDDTQETTNVLEETSCTSCGKVGPKIFDNAPWVCLEDGCKEFFQVAGNMLSQIGDDNKELRYSKDFINHITTYENLLNIPTMFQPLPEALIEGGENYGTEKALRGGMTCPKCRCCTSRKYWDRLACCNCGFEYNAAPLPYPLNKVEEENKAHTQKLQAKNAGLREDGVTIKQNEDYVDLFVEKDEDGMSTRFIYMIKNARWELIGSFVVERPSDAAKKAPGGANELYTGIEAAGSNMHFQRNPARCPGSTSETLTRHFQSNFGALYDFGVKNIATKPFNDAPDVVLQSLVYLKHFGEKALKSSQLMVTRKDYRPIAGSTIHTPQKPFNELLALAYRETDKINWHDDGEDQLTGVISTASFGSPGRMALRFKKGETILEVQLRHGDVATMCDTRLQALTDHTVIPEGIRRYAMTSRTINFDHYRQPKQKAKLVQRGLTIEKMEEAAQFPERAMSFAYNGTTLGSQQEDAA